MGLLSDLDLLKNTLRLLRILRKRSFRRFTGATARSSAVDTWAPSGKLGGLRDG